MSCVSYRRLIENTRFLGIPYVNQLLTSSGHRSPKTQNETKWFDHIYSGRCIQSERVNQFELKQLYKTLLGINFC